MKFLLNKRFALLDYGEFTVIYPKGFLNKFRVFTARLILPQAVGVLILKKPPEENLIPQSLWEYVKSVSGSVCESKDTSSREDTHEQG